jgi:hypothetical protein
MRLNNVAPRGIQPLGSTTMITVNCTHTVTADKSTASNTQLPASCPLSGYSMDAQTEATH